MNTWPTDKEDLSAIYSDFSSRFGSTKAVIEMSAEYGIGTTTVRQRLAEAGIRMPRPYRTRKPSDEELAEAYGSAVAEFGERWAIGKVAKQYGVVYMTVRTWLTESGLHTVAPQAPRRPITEPCPCGAVATTRYKDQDPALCFRCYMRTYAADKNSKFRRAARAYVDEIKATAVCVDCVAEGRDGHWPPAVLHFDHVPERGPKLFNIGQCDYAIKKVEAEIAKCDIVCANHHAIRTWHSDRGKAAS